MILTVDVAYQKDAAIVGGILFRDWTDEKPLKELVISCSIPDNYMPGQFYRRELPCIAALLEQVPEALDCILIDGYVHLGRAREPGLGKHLRDMLEQKVAVIGVAKTAYKDTPKSCEVLRGKSRNPLYVTADGIKQDRAAFLIKNMHGQDRIPTLLKYVDSLCRAAAAR
jgi:deoxyribonuclease V